MGFVPAALARDVPAKWQTAYQGRVTACLWQGGQLLEEFLESRFRGGYQAARNMPYPIPIPLRLNGEPILVAAHEHLV